MNKSKLIARAFLLLTLCLSAVLLTRPALAQEDPGELSILQGDDDEIYGQETTASRFALQGDDAEIYVRDSLPTSPLTTLQGDDQEIYTTGNPLYRLQGDDNEIFAVGAVAIAWAELQGDDAAIFITDPAEIIVEESQDTILLAAMPAANPSALDTLPNTTGIGLPDMTSGTENEITIDNTFLIVGGGLVLLLIGIAIGNLLSGGLMIPKSREAK
jgi:hypothetical protein